MKEKNYCRHWISISRNYTFSYHSHTFLKILRFQILRPPIPQILRPPISTVSLGMFTIPEYRGKNIGKKTLNYLLGESRKYNLTPTAGCWDSHKLSKRVLEGVGMVSDSKYLKISFQ